MANVAAGGVRDLSALLIGLTLAFWTEDLARIFSSSWTDPHPHHTGPQAKGTEQGVSQPPDDLDFADHVSSPDAASPAPSVAATTLQPEDITPGHLPMGPQADTVQQGASQAQGLDLDMGEDESGLEGDLRPAPASDPVSTLNRILGTDNDDILIGTAGSDLILGGGGDDHLDGAGGDDALLGGLGSDTLVGGNGNDVLVVDRTTDVVIERPDEGQDTILATGWDTDSFTLADLPDVENAIWLGDAPLTITGNDADNILIARFAAVDLRGGAGDDVLLSGSGNDRVDGGLGADILMGGAGNDTYVTDNIADVVVEADDAGIDTVLAQANVAVLAKNVENLIFVGNGSFVGVGNGLANWIWGGDFDDALFGEQLDAPIQLQATPAPVDQAADLIGNAIVQAALTEILGENQEPLEFLSEIDVLSDNKDLPKLGVFIGDADGEKLSGRSGRDDFIFGGGGNDRIDGGTGNDTLVGGIGNDTFIFRKDFGNDVITDFGFVAGDRDFILFDDNLLEDGATFADHIQQVGQDVVISFSAGESLTLQNVDLMKLSINDQFIFT